MLSIGLGAIVGVILALTGAGGAILAVPLLIFALHLDVAQAAPIALLAVGLSAAAGAAVGLRAGIVRYRAALLMAAVGMLASPAGIWLAHRIPSAPLTIIFAGVLAFVAWRMFTQNALSAAHGTQPNPATPCRIGEHSGRFIWNAACARALALSGLGAGFLSGLLGVGGGFVVVPALKRASNAPVQGIVATSLAVIALVSASGVAASAIAGNLDWQLGLPFASGAMLGMFAGRSLSSRLNGPGLQKLFALVVGAVAAGMVVKVFVTP